MAGKKPLYRGGFVVAILTGHFHFGYLLFGYTFNYYEVIKIAICQISDSLNLFESDKAPENQYYGG